jgi:hypothetical protein
MLGKLLSACSFAPPRFVGTSLKTAVLSRAWLGGVRFGAGKPAPAIVSRVQKAEIKAVICFMTLSI